MASSKSPESDALNNEFKGKRVEITWLDGTHDIGILEWVDRYTYGVRHLSKAVPSLHIVNKAAIRHIRPCPVQE